MVPTQAKILFYASKSTIASHLPLSANQFPLFRLKEYINLKICGTILKTPYLNCKPCTDQLSNTGFRRMEQ